MKPALIARWWTVAYAVMLISALAVFALSTGTFPTIQNTIGTFWKSRVIELLGIQSRIWDLMLIPYFWYALDKILASTGPETSDRDKAMDAFAALTILFTLTGIFIAAAIMVGIGVYLVWIKKK